MFEPVVLLARVVVGSSLLVTGDARWRLVTATLLTLFATAMAGALARGLEPDRRGTAFVLEQRRRREHRDRRRAVDVLRPVLG